MSCLEISAYTRGLPTRSFFVIQNTKDEELWAKYIDLEAQPPIDRERNFRTFKADFYERVIQVYGTNEEGVCPLPFGPGTYDPDLASSDYQQGNMSKDHNSMKKRMFHKEIIDPYRSAFPGDGVDLARAVTARFKVILAFLHNHNSEGFDYRHPACVTLS